METREFSMPHGRFITMLFRDYARWPLLVAAALVLTGIVLGVCIDYRFAVIALMIVFIALPMLLVMLYIIHGMRPECFCNINVHRIAFTGDGLIKVTILGREDEEGNRPEIRTCQWDVSDVAEIRISPDIFKIVLDSDKARGFLWVPASVLPEGTDLASMLRPATNR